jgi:hypothetical protein
MFAGKSTGSEGPWRQFSLWKVVDVSSCWRRKNGGNKEFWLFGFRLRIIIQKNFNTLKTTGKISTRSRSLRIHMVIKNVDSLSWLVLAWIILKVY